MADLPLIFSSPDPSTVASWKVRAGEAFLENQILVEVDSRTPTGHLKKNPLTAPKSGYLKSIKVRDGAAVKSDEPIGFFVECSHDIQYAGMCTECGKDVSRLDLSSVVHGHIQLSVSQKEAQRIDKANAERLLRANKLSLVLDLDNTLVHAVMVHNLTQDVSVMLAEGSDSTDIYEFTLPPLPHKYMVKFRPGLISFLKSLNRIYELHIYSFGTRQYANKIAELINAQVHLFDPDKIVSRDDCEDMNLKNLKRLFPCDDSMVLILDDREDVWMTPQGTVTKNLIRVEPFHFFEASQEVNELPMDKEKKKAENGTPQTPKLKYDPNYLNYAEDLLTRVHTEFYNSVKDRDVKNILQKFKQDVFRGCVLVFSSLIPINSPSESSDIWKTAEAFGARCTNELTGGLTPTHVIAAKAGTDKVTKAMAAPSLYLVSVDWFNNCTRMWRHLPETDYPLAGLPVLMEGTPPPVLRVEEPKQETPKRPVKRQRIEPPSSKAAKVEEKPAKTSVEDKDLFGEDDEDDDEMTSFLEEEMMRQEEEDEEIGRNDDDFEGE
eukprot:TRINITY_DN5968_c0_g1_i1.p1 TRINITY_DN5968_c0_g1~~TRINITY_DN5968_c0_g1_i1.p1  ORF type:complete len:583 (-),score=132.20 TRINITY_DN5968_c0_g1_i1:26-1672(-)